MSTRLRLEPYAEQRPLWPASGRHVLAQYDTDAIVVYQAYRSEIGLHTAQRGTTADIFGSVSEENVARIKRQNGRRISVIIGNPPYNANQANENDNNKNREYPQIDQRIKSTYIAESTAQKTKLYDMYARFFRWASDRLDANGVLAFVTQGLSTGYYLFYFAPVFGGYALWADICAPSAERVHRASKAADRVVIVTEKDAATLRKGDGSLPFASETADGIPKHSQFTQEFRVESNEWGDFDWQAGLFWFDEDITIDSFNYDSSKNFFNIILLIFD